MRVLFVDDSGNRGNQPGEPYFCLGAFSVDSGDLHQLQHRLKNLKRTWKLDPMFVPSHHSPGVQFADFVAGAAGRWWNYRDDKYVRVLEPSLAAGSGRWQGAGMKSFRAPNYPLLDEADAE